METTYLYAGFLLYTSVGTFVKNSLIFAAYRAIWQEGEIAWEVVCFLPNMTGMNIGAKPGDTPVVIHVICLTAKDCVTKIGCNLMSNTAASRIVVLSIVSFSSATDNALLVIIFILFGIKPHISAEMNTNVNLIAKCLVYVK